jgi:DNA-binding MarR family transcriptional regulator
VSETGALSGIAGYLLRRAHNLFALHWQLGFRQTDFPLTPVQGGILLMLDEPGDQTQAMLARRLGVEAPTVQIAIDRLVELGCVARQRPDGNARSFHLRLTERGHAAAEAVRVFGEEREATLLAPLNDEERRTLLDLLDRLVSHGQGVVRGMQQR